jgi:hypothetical protein
MMKGLKLYLKNEQGELKLYLKKFRNQIEILSGML